jgi:hypothetical protein
METAQLAQGRYVRHDRAIEAMLIAVNGYVAAHAELVAAGDELRRDGLHQHYRG